MVKTVTSTIPLFREGTIVGAMELYRPLDSYSELRERINLLSNVKTQDESSVKGNGIGPNYTKSNGTRYTLDHMIGRSSTILQLKKNGKGCC